ncbi:hypothetical protein [Lysobacter panacisoli]|uniref:DUF3426 domain-containing protein n=1 Tax=Lysobacter panacisoli TaxID=1255263 RepID=A0ABP9LIC1_9GAMM|nr:hypothetical protein [Lysobacter panacisoli]
MRMQAMIALLVAAPFLAQPLYAAENQVVKCKTRQARKSAPYAGPALVANVPKSMTPIDLNSVQFTDKGLTRQVLVEGLFARRTETDTVEVTARLINCTGEPLQVQARSSFMDAAQAPTEPTSTWSKVFIPAYGTGIYRERSMARDDVSYYLIELSSAP